MFLLFASASESEFRALVVSGGNHDLKPEKINPISSYISSELSVPPC